MDVLPRSAPQMPRWNRAESLLAPEPTLVPTTATVISIGNRV